MILAAVQLTIINQVCCKLLYTMYLFIPIVCVWVLTCMYACAPCAGLGPAEASSGATDADELWWELLGTVTGSLPELEVLLLSFSWTVSLASHF